MRTSRALKTLLVTAVAVSLPLLAACGDEGDPAASASPSAPASGSPAASASPSASAASVKPSDNLDAIKVTGEYGEEPKVTFKALAKMMTESDWELAKRERVIADHAPKK